MRSDEQLAAAAAAGDENAFAELVDRYQSRLFRFLLVRAERRVDAEDALQDAFMNAYRYIDSFDSRYRFSTWLYRIAMRAALRRDEAPQPDGAEIEDAADGPLDHCLREADRANLWATAKGVLSPEAYAAMWLRYVEDLPVADVGTVLGRTESWTKVTLKRSRDRLSAALGGRARADAQRGAYG